MTAEEINRKVAEAMGWSGLENADACIAEMFPYPDELDGAQLAEATASGWFGWAPDAKGPSSVGGEPYEGADKEPTPDYSRDAAAADLVRQEIERREWIWRIEKDWQSVGLSPYIAYVSASFIPCPAPHKRGMVSAEANSPHEALCLAFLAACEASKEVE